MNVENVNELIDHLKSIDDSEYDQRMYTHECGTPACIAGHSVYLAEGENYDIEYHNDDTNDYENYNYENYNNENYDISYEAADWLDISNEQTAILFRPYPLGKNEEITKLEAIMMLKNFIKTDQVVWRKESEY